MEISKRNLERLIVCERIMCNIALKNTLSRSRVIEIYKSAAEVYEPQNGDTIAFLYADGASRDDDEPLGIYIIPSGEHFEEKYKLL